MAKANHSEKSDAEFLDQLAKLSPGGTSQKFIDPGTLLSIFTGIKQILAMCSGSSESMSERMVDPNETDREMLYKIARKETKKRITRRRNPTGERITRRERDILRESYTRESYQASLNSAKVQGETNCGQLVSELRGET